MTPGGWLVIGVIVLIVAAGGSVAIFGAASRWALGREADRTAGATFERDYVAHPADVADQDYPAMVEEMCALLEDSRVHVERLLFAAEIAELEESA